MTDSDDEHQDSARNPRGTRRALLAATATTAAGSAGCLTITTPADRAAATTPRGRIDYFVGSPWLTERRREVVVLDARPRSAFRRERIYGARRVPLDGITARRNGSEGTIPDPSSIAETLGALGVAPDDDVVVYGESVGSRVTRTVFALQSIGHRGDVRVLNGGLDGWTGRLGTGDPRDSASVPYDPVADESAVVTREWIADRVGTFNEDGPGLIDVRHPDRFLADDEPSPALDRHGHLPGAVNVHWLGNIDGPRLRAPGELFQLYEQRAGIAPAEPAVVYGDENVDPTQTWVTLRALGFEDVRLYEGGFHEWANVSGDRGRYPVETKTDAVIETAGGDQEDDSGDFSCTG